MPQDVFVWGRDDKGILPVAWKSESAQWLSTDPADGDNTAHVLLPVPLVAPGDPLTTVMNRIVVVVHTSDAEDAGTNDSVNLTIRRPANNSVVDAELTGLKQSRGSFFVLPVDVPFTRDGFGAAPVRLKAGGADAWLPLEFYIFGLDTTQGPPGRMVPLVHIPGWTLGWLSTDPDDADGTAQPTVDLPFVAQ